MSGDVVGFPPSLVSVSAAATYHPRRIDVLVSDARPPAAIRALLKKNDVRLVVA